MFLENKSYLFYLLISMAFQKIFHFNTSTNQQLENFLCVTEGSPQKGFHLAQKGRFIVVQPITGPFFALLSLNSMKQKFNLPPSNTQDSKDDQLPRFL